MVTMRVEYYCLVGCDAMWSGRNSVTFLQGNL